MKNPLWVRLEFSNKEEGVEKYQWLGLRPVDAWTQLRYLQPLLSCFTEALIESNKNPNDHSLSDACLSIAQEIVNLHEVVNRPGKYGFDIDCLSASDFQYLFTDHTRGSNQSDHPIGAIQYSILPQIPENIPQGEPPEFPPWASGDYLCDKTANIIAATQSVEQAILLLKNFNFEEVELITIRLNDINKGEDARETEKAAQLYEEHMSNLSEEQAQKLYSFS